MRFFLNKNWRRARSATFAATAVCLAAIAAGNALSDAKAAAAGATSGAAAQNQTVKKSPSKPAKRPLTPLTPEERFAPKTPFSAPAMPLVAHRGFSHKFPENTLSSFRGAIAAGADGCEFDVRKTRDGKIIVLHDATLSRTAKAPRVRDAARASITKVAALTLAEVSTFDAGARKGSQFAGERVPTLREVFELIAPTGLEINVEIKDSVIPYFAIGDKVSALVDEFDLEQRVTLSSFNHCSLAWLRQNGSMVRTGVLFGDILYEPWNYAAQIWATALHPHLHYVDYVFNLIDEAHANLLDVNVWTVNEPDDIRRMIARGVDAIITNYPERVLARR